MVFLYLPSLSGMRVCLGKVSALPGVPKMPLTLRKHTLWGKDRDFGCGCVVSGACRGLLYVRLTSEALSLSLSALSVEHQLTGRVWCTRGSSRVLCLRVFFSFMQQGRTMWTLASLSPTPCFSMSRAASLCGWVDVARSTSSTSLRARTPLCAR